MRIYIETTIPSYLVARPARDRMKAACQQITKDWWRRKRGEHELFSSQIVLDEIAAGEPKMAQLRLEAMANTTIVRLIPDAEILTQRVLRSGLLPPDADRDAAHIALATVHRMDLLLTWNCRHIANPAIQARLRRLAESLGWALPALCTPYEMIGGLYEEHGEGSQDS